MSKFKVGDKVLVTKPEKNKHLEYDQLPWCNAMDVKHKTIQSIYSKDGLYYKLQGDEYYYHPDWLMPIGELGEAIYED